MNDNLQRQTPSEQVRSYHKISHASFRRSFKAQHDEDAIELLNHISKLRHLLFIHGVNPAETDALLKKHGVKR